MIHATRLYQLYGLRVCSQIQLPAPLVDDLLSPCDIHICWGDPGLPGAEAGDPVLAYFLLPDGRGYTLTDNGSGYTLCFHQTCAFTLDYDLATVRVHLYPGVNPDMAGLLLVGNVMACILTLRGEPVLHASAVEIDGVALAFVGRSGMGKSTLAALLCAHAARFVTDDLLRLRADGDDFRCFPGTGQIRLRKSSAALAAGLSSAAQAITPDDRIAVQMEDDFSMPRLGALVVPLLSRRCQTLHLQRCAPTVVLQHLMTFPRIQGLQRQVHLQRQIDWFGRIAAAVPFFQAEIPWGLPLSPDLAPELVRGVVGRNGIPPA